MIELNLLPDLKKDFIRAQRMRNLVISASIVVTMVAGGLTVLLLLTVYGGQTLISNNLDGSIKKNYDILSKKPEIDKYLTVQNQLKNLDGLHSERYAYAKALDYLQQLNPSEPNNVALSAALLTKDSKSLVIEGTTNNFESLNVFKNTLENAQLTYTLDGKPETVKLFDTVKLDEAVVTSLGTRKLASFKFSLTYPKEAFISSIPETAISVPKATLSDGDSSAPKQLFGNQPGGQ